jgi:hypothetical protein
MEPEIFVDKFIAAVSHFKANLERDGSIIEQDLSFNYIYTVTLFDDSEDLFYDAMISSMTFYFSRLSSWLFSRCQIATRNQFREVGLNWHSAFPRDEILSKLVAKRIKKHVANELVDAFIIPTSPSPPLQEEYAILHPQVEVLRSQPKKTEKYGSRVKSLLSRVF